MGLPHVLSVPVARAAGVGTALGELGARVPWEERAGEAFLSVSPSLPSPKGKEGWQATWLAMGEVHTQGAKVRGGC